MIIHITNKVLKKCLASLITRDLQIKTIIYSYIHQFGKKQKIPTAGETVEKRDLSYTAGESIN